MPHVRTLDSFLPSDAARFGGKAMHCGLLHQAGFDVPPSIAIAFDAGEVAHVPLEVQTWLDARASWRFAVRSSAPGEDGGSNSFAGVHESILDVGAEDVSGAVEACVASMHSDRARLYRTTRGIEESSAAGVLIQRMIEPLRAGVAFTADPVTGDDGMIVINSTKGRGEAVVAGSVAADELRVSKREPRVEGRMRELVDLLLRVETLYGAPQDVEWCDDGRVFWLVQSRPITTPLVPHDIEWTRANVREVLPEIPPHGVAQMICAMIGSAYRATNGPMAPAALGPVLRTIQGRIYFNLTLIGHMAHVTGESAATILRALGHSDAITAAEEVRPRPHVPTLLRSFPMIAKLIAFHLRPLATVEREVSKLRAIHAELRALPLATISDEEILSHLRHWLDEAPRSMPLVFYLGSAMALERPLVEICTKRGIDFTTLFHARLAAGEKSVTSQQGLDLLTLARLARERPDAFAEAWTQFLALYGHRGIFESDWSRPRYSEDPSPLRSAIDAHRGGGAIADPEETAARQERTWETEWANASQRLGSVERRIAQFLLERLKKMHVWRERYRSELTRIMTPVRNLSLELSRRYVERAWLDGVEDCFLLTFDELGLRSGAKAVARARRAQREAFATLEMPLLLRAARVPDAIEVLDGALRGLCVSSGIVEGSVVVLHDPSDGARMKPGAILVAPATDPAWTPLFTLAAGVITEIGGTLSHAATLARELGVPAVANVRNATTLLRDGMRVRLDASAGVITILEPGPRHPEPAKRGEGSQVT